MDININEPAGSPGEGDGIDMDVAGISRNIYISCDVDNINSVPVSRLIDFIKPYMAEDLESLKELRSKLDPEQKDICVSNELFNEALMQWCKKVAGSPNVESEFDKTPSHLQLMDLPYNHSTPRASLGDKLVRCKDLLNLSNISGYSLSSSRLDADTSLNADKAVLEEEVKKLHHQLSKLSDELDTARQQLTISEEQNEMLQNDVERLNRRLFAEQQVLEHLQKDKTFDEETREELNTYKKTADEFKKKLSQTERDNQLLKDTVVDLEKEKAELQEKNRYLSKSKQEAVKEVSDLITELETKNQEIIDITRHNDELRAKYKEQKDIIDELKNENDMLNHEKFALEEAFKTPPLTLENHTSPKIGQKQESNKISCTNQDKQSETHGSLKSEIQKVYPAYNELSSSLSALYEHEINELKTLNKTLEEKTKNSEISLETLNIMNNFSNEINSHVEERKCVVNELKELNKQLQTNMKMMQIELHTKSNQITNLRTELKNDMKVKNKLWGALREVENIKKINDDLTERQRDQFVNYNELLQAHEKLQIEHSNILVLYDLEVSKNTKLVGECDELKSKLEEDVSRNQNLSAKNFELLQALEKLEIKHNNVMVMYDLEVCKNITLVSELQLELQQKMSKNQDLSIKNSELLEALKKLEIEHGNILDEYNVEVTKNRKLVGECDQLKSEVSKNQNLSMKNLELVQALEKLEMEHSNIILVRDLEISKNAKLMVEYDQLKLQLQQESAKNNYLNAVLKSVQVENEKLNSDVLSVTALYDNSKVTLNEAISEITALNSKLSALSTDIEKLTENQYHLKSNLENVEDLLTKANKEIKDLKSENSQLECQLNEEENENIELKARVEHLDASLRQATLNLSVLTTTCESLTAEYENLKLQHSKCHNKDTEIQNLTKELELLKTDLKKDVEKKPSFTKQQIKIDKLREALEKSEAELKYEKKKRNELAKELQELKTDILLKQQKLKELHGEYLEVVEQNKKLQEIDLGEKELKEIKEDIEKARGELGELRKEVEQSKMELSLTNNSLEQSKQQIAVIQSGGRAINKFTLSTKHNTSCPASPDSPSVDREIRGTAKKLYEDYPDDGDTAVEIPLLKFYDISEDLLEELELAEHSPKKIFTKEEIEKKVTTLALRLFISSSDIGQRLCKEKEVYRLRYEKLVTLCRDISNRLRDHVCIGTSEPIIPVFVLLEQLKMDLKELVQSAGQVGVLMYESKLKKCWNLVTNYMAMIKKENEHLQNSVRSVTSTPRTGIFGRKAKLDKENHCIYETSPRVGYATSTKIVIFLLILSFVACIFIDLECRLTSTYSRYCPLDGIVTRQNFGMPPM